MTYLEIHQLYKEGFSKSAISRKLNISRNTVIDYLEASGTDGSYVYLIFTNPYFLLFLLST
jgi:transposase